MHGQSMQQLQDMIPDETVWTLVLSLLTRGRLLIDVDASVALCIFCGSMWCNHYLCTMCLTSALAVQTPPVYSVPGTRTSSCMPYEG